MERRGLLYEGALRVEGRRFQKNQGVPMYMQVARTLMGN